MKISSRLSALSLALWVFVTPVAWAQPDDCERPLQSAVKPDPSLWFELSNALHARVADVANPFLGTDANANAVGLVHERLRKAVSWYDALEDVGINLVSSDPFSVEQYAQARGLIEPAVRQVLSNPNASHAEIFAAISAVRRLSAVESRTRFPIDPSDTQEEKKEDANEGETTGEQGDEEEEEEDLEDPVEERIDQYNAHNKRLQEGKKKKTKVVFKTTELHKTGLYPLHHLDIIQGSLGARNPVFRPKPVAPASSTIAPNRFTTFSTYGHKRIPLHTVYGSQPIAGPVPNVNATVIEEAPGEFVLLIHDDSPPAEVKVYLTDVPKLRFDYADDELRYAIHSGVAENLWPEDIRQFVQKMRGKGVRDNRTLAEEVTNFVHLRFKYYSQSKTVTEQELDTADAQLAELLKTHPPVIAMAHLGYLNCDWAAIVAATIVRDFFKVPARIAAGRTRSKTMRENGVVLDYTETGRPKHAWMEVFDDGAWHPYDPTPDHDAGGQSNGSPSDKEARREKSGGKDAGNGDSRSPGEEKKEDRREVREEVPQEVRNETQRQETPSAEGAEEVEYLLPIDRVPEEPADYVELYRKGFHEIGVAAFESSLSAKNSAKKLQEFLNVMEDMIRKTPDGKPNNNTTYEKVSASIRAKLRMEITRRIEYSDGTLHERLTRAQSLAAQRRLRESWMEIYNIREDLRALESVRELQPQEILFLKQINDTLAIFNRIKHPKSAEFDLVDRIMRALPGPITKTLIREDYGNEARTPGSNGMLNFAEDLKSGKKAGLARIALLSNYVRMVLASVKEPLWKTQPTFDRALVPKGRNDDLVIARSIFEFPRMLLAPRPGDHLFGPFLRREQFALGTVETERVPSPKNPLERKITIIPYDISGSMEGDPLAVQDALIAAFIDSAFTETDMRGNPLHEVILVPFDGEVYEPIYVKDRVKALEEIRSRVAMVTKSQGSTDLTKPLVRAYNEIHRAQTDQSQLNRFRKLTRANIVFFTDGQDPDFNLQAVLNARDQISEHVKVYVNFVGINGTNPQIEELAQNSNLGSVQPMLRIIDGEMVRKVVHESRNLKLNKNAFAEDPDHPDAPGDLMGALASLSRSVPRSFSQDVDPSKYIELTSRIPRRAPKMDPDVNAAMILLFARQVKAMASPLLRPARQRIVYMLLTHYPRLVNKLIESLNLEEASAMKGLAEWAAEGHGS